MIILKIYLKYFISVENTLVLVKMNDIIAVVSGE